MAPLVALLLLLLFSASSSPVSTTPSLDIAHAAAAAELNNHYVVVAASSLETESPVVCQGHRVNPPWAGSNLTGRAWTPLSRHDGPCSSAGGTPPPSLADTLLWDQQRASYIQRKLAGVIIDDEGDPHNAGMGATLIGRDQTIRPNSGSQGTNGSPNSAQPTELAGVSPTATGGGGQLPGVTQTMVVDTSSDVPWLQCAPCPAPQCHPQTDTLYDPRKSAGTYAPFLCNSPACRQLGPYANGCTGAGNTGQCQYRVRYPDGSASTGTYISDLLTLNANPNGAISKFQFGCSHALQRPGSFNNRTAGIMALGRGAQSLPTQTKGTYGHVFSYCFTPTASTQGFFILGVPDHASSRYALTPMLRSNVAPMLYLVRLNAIIVAGQRLPVPPTVFAAGAVMDSRTLITRLPPTAYMALRAAFRGQMRAYRAVAPKGQLDTCYDFTGVRGGVKLPKITLVFDRSSPVELDPSGVLLGSCLAFAPNSNDRMQGIIGTVQQYTLEVLYNVGGETVGFRRAAC